MVGQHQVVVDGLGHADEADLAVDGLAVGAQLGDRVHRVVAADVEHRADVVLPEQLKQLHKRLLVNDGVGQLVAAAAQEAGRRALEQLNVHLVAQHGIQIDELALEHALDAVLHPVDMGCAAGLGGLIDARQTGVDDGSRAARLTNQNIFHKFTSRIFYCILQYIFFYSRCHAVMIVVIRRDIGNFPDVVGGVAHGHTQTRR